MLSDSTKQCKLHRATCRRFDTIPACDGRTDGQTDGIAVASTALAKQRAVIILVRRQEQLITFRVTRRRRKMYSGHARLCVCQCLSAIACPHYCNDPDVTWGTVGGAPSCALFGGFAIGARVAFL